MCGNPLRLSDADPVRGAFLSCADVLVSFSWQGTSPACAVAPMALQGHARGRAGHGSSGWPHPLWEGHAWRWLDVVSDAASCTEPGDALSHAARRTPGTAGIRVRDAVAYVAGELLPDLLTELPAPRRLQRLAPDVLIGQGSTLR